MNQFYQNHVLKVWYKAFKGGREIVEGMSRSRRPVELENIEKIKKIMFGNWHSNLRKIAPWSLHLSRICSFDFGGYFEHETCRYTLVPKIWILIKNITVSRSFWTCWIAPILIFMERIIAGNETSVYEFDMQTSQKSLEWRTKDELKPKKLRQRRSKVKVIFFDIRGFVYHEFIPER